MSADPIVEAAVRKFGPQSVEQLIQRESTRQVFQAERKTKFISGPGFAGHIHTEGEKVLHLPGGETVRITTDESGKATHVESDECLHAIVRPDTYRPKTRLP